MTETILSFEKSVPRDMLDQLCARSRAAFAASCAERILPAYSAYSAAVEGLDTNAFRSALDLVWEWAKSDTASMSGQILRMIARCSDLLPGDDATGGEYADDAAAAVVYCLQTTQGDAEAALWAARRVYEAVDHYVINHAGLGLDEDEDSVLRHPLIQAELHRQRTDLTDLLSAQDRLTTIAKLKKRSAAAASRLFAG